MSLVDLFNKLFALNVHRKKEKKDYSEVAFDMPVEMLRKLPWLIKLNKDMFQRVLDGFSCRQYREGIRLLKEGDYDTGMFVLVEGKVKIMIRGVSVDLLGAGSLIGEMSVLTAYPRSASIVAETALKVLWMESKSIKALMKKSKELENGLWEFTSKRFAMNLLGTREPFNQWEQNSFLQWLAVGEIKVPNRNGVIDLEGKVAVLVTGTAAQHDGSSVIKSPATLEGTDYIFSKEARVFLRDK